MREWTRTQASASGNVRGFTIVELLIVIVVIAILAAITIVAYNGIQERASSAAVISEAQAYVKGLKLWEADVGRPTTSSCIAPSTYTTCANSPGWTTNTTVDAAFMSNLVSYSGVKQMTLGAYGLSSTSPKGQMWFHANYFSANRGVLTYFVGPHSNCGLPNVLSMTAPPSFSGLTVAGADYTTRDANGTMCMIEVFKW